MDLHQITYLILFQSTPYNLKNSNNIRSIRTNTNIFFHFFPFTIIAWNGLSDDIKNAPTVTSFKYQLNKDRQTQSKYFQAGSRMGQVLHARLRMGCSSLNADLYRQNIVPSPSCSCGGSQSTYHFLFMCPNYNDIKYTYLPNNLYTLDIHQLLPGIPSSNNVENETLFLQVQDFILHSRRFV